MARSFAEAFAKVEGPEFDLAVGYAVPPRKHAPIDEAIELAFEGFDYLHIVRKLSSRHRCHRTDAEDAVQDTFEALLVKRPGLYREDPETWLGLLYSESHYRLLEIMAPTGRRTESIEGLSDAMGDAPFNGARRCIPPSLDANDGYRYVPPPADGEAWNRTQIIGAIQRFRDYYGWAPRAKECRSINRLPSTTTICRHFGDLASAILAAGMIPDTLGRRRKRWGPIEAAKACLSFRWHNGYWPSSAEARRNPGELPGRSAMLRFFGGTRAAEVQLGAEAILFGLEATAA
jgi:hypothetical protein